MDQPRLSEQLSQYYKIVTSVVLPSPVDPKKFIYVHTKKDDKWGLPAGKLEPFELPHDGGVREVLEETGSTAIIDRLIGLYCFRSERGSPILSIAYGGRIETGIPKVERKEEVDAVAELSLAQVREIYRRGQLRGQPSLRPLEEYISGRSLPLDTIRSF